MKSNEQRKREERRKKKSEGQFNTGEVNTWTNRKHIFPCRFPFLICAEICSLLSSTHFYPKFLPQGIFVPSQGEMFFAFLWFLQISSSERLFALPVSSVLCLVVFSTTLHLGELTWVYWMGLLNHHLHVSIPDINSIWKKLFFILVFYFKIKSVATSSSITIISYFDHNYINDKIHLYLYSSCEVINIMVF